MTKYIDALYYFIRSWISVIVDISPLRGRSLATALSMFVGTISNCLDASAAGNYTLKNYSLMCQFDDKYAVMMMEIDVAKGKLEKHGIFTADGDPQNYRVIQLASGEGIMFDFIMGDRKENSMEVKVLDGENNGNIDNDTYLKAIATILPFSEKKYDVEGYCFTLDYD